MCTTVINNLEALENVHIKYDTAGRRVKMLIFLNSKALNYLSSSAFALEASHEIATV